MLDCETPLGSVFIKKQRSVQDFLSSRGYTVVEMAGKDNPVDVILCRELEGRMTAVGVCEIRSRLHAGTVPVTLEYLKNNGGYLITMRKVQDGINLSKLMQVPYYVLVYLIHEDRILVWKISDSGGNPLERISTRTTQTRKTVNGGTAVRENAYLSVDSPNLTVYEEKNFAER